MSNEYEQLPYLRYQLVNELRDFKAGVAKPEEVLAAIEALVVELIRKEQP